MSEKAPKFNESLHKNPDTGKFETKKEQVDKAKRKSLKKIGQIATGIAVAGIPEWSSRDQSDADRQKNVKTGHEKPKTEQREKKLEVVAPEEQLERYGEIHDPEGAVEAICKEHREMLESSNRLEEATRLRRELGLDYDEFVAPFVKRGLNADLAYLIPYQESDFDKDKVSPSGAKGLFQIRDIAAEDVDMTTYDPHEPLEGNQIAAAYLSKNRDDYKVGNNSEVLLHSYNSGWKLEGFTPETDEHDKTPENLHQYLCEKITRKYKQAKKEKLAHEEILRNVVGKELEVLRYAPELQTKGEVLFEKGLLADLEERLNESDTLLAYHEIPESPQVASAN